MSPQFFLCGDPRVAASVLLADPDQVIKAKLLQLVPAGVHCEVEAELVHIEVESIPET